MLIIEFAVVHSAFDGTWYPDMHGQRVDHPQSDHRSVQLLAVSDTEVCHVPTADAPQLCVSRFQEQLFTGPTELEKSHATSSHAWKNFQEFHSLVAHHAYAVVAPTLQRAHTCGAAAPFVQIATSGLEQLPCVLEEVPIPVAVTVIVAPL